MGAHKGDTLEIYVRTKECHHQSLVAKILSGKGSNLTLSGLRRSDTRMTADLYHPETA